MNSECQSVSLAYCESKFYPLPVNAPVVSRRAGIAGGNGIFTVRRRQLQHAADGEYPFTNPANAGMRRKFDLPLDRPLNP
jgi:hypothetical protein